MRGLLLLSLLLLPASGCADDPPPDPVPSTPLSPAPRPATADSSRDAVERPPPAVPPETFDAPTTIFDTVESPPPRTFTPPRPVPAPPAPPQEPVRLPPPPPDAETAWGRCDIRPSEPYCFSYVGAGWTAGDAEAHCDSAPGGSFGASACPDARRIATCTFERPGEEAQSLVYAYYAPYPLDLARLACPGEFREGD